MPLILISKLNANDYRRQKPQIRIWIDIYIAPQPQVMTLLISTIKVYPISTMIIPKMLNLGYTLRVEARSCFI